MKLTAKGHCALKAILVLAVHQPKRLSVKIIAQKQGLSPRYLEQIFSTLKNHKLIGATKGPHGGYTLLRTPDSIDLMEIIQAVEGEHAFESGQESDVVGEVIDNVLENLDGMVDKYLRETSLADLVKAYHKKTHEGYMYFI